MFQMKCNANLHENAYLFRKELVLYETNRHRLIPVLAFFLLCLLAALSFKPSVKAADETGGSRKVMRVGFLTEENLSERQADGSYTGYTADYLNELVKYTDWEIRYVEVKGNTNTQLHTLSDMLDSGDIDILGMMYRNDYLQKLYLYPTYNYGSSYTALTVAMNSNLWQSDDFQSWDKMRVATCPDLKNRMKQLEQFAQISGFTYNTIHYKTMEEVQEAVLSGEADACLQVDIHIPPTMRSIARFNPKPYYFAVNKERSDILKELNSAMYKLLEAYPSLQSELYSHYYIQKDSFWLSEEKTKWVQSLSPMRILYITGNAPIQDEQDGAAIGVAASFMEAFSKASGLKTIPVFAKNYNEAAMLISKGSVDMIVAMSGSSKLNTEARISLSLPYFESSSVWVTNESSDKNREMSVYMPASVQSELNYLKHRKKSVLLDAYCVSHYMRKNNIYDNLYVEWADRDTISYSVGLLPSVDSQLAEILNGYIDSLSDQTKQAMLYANSREQIRYTFAERIEMYQWQILAVLAGIVILALLLSRWHRNRIMQENSAEVERLHQFSLMINESLIKYDVKRDRLIMQNNKIVFPDIEVIQPFLAKGADVSITSENERRYVERLREMMRNQITTSELELYQDGAPRWHRIDLAYVNNEYTIGRLSDINKEVRQRTLLEHEASHDALTGMMNRSALQVRIQNHLQHEKNGVFLLLDLDNFKMVNDTMGHHEGDKVLQSFAAFLDINFRIEDYKARLGGDEFVVFLPARITEDVLRDKLEQFMLDIYKQIFIKYRQCHLSVSIGAAYATENLQSFEALYREADQAMYVAKHSGKNNFFISDGKACAKEDCTGCQESL